MATAVATHFQPAFPIPGRSSSLKKKKQQHRRAQSLPVHNLNLPFLRNLIVPDRVSSLSRSGPHKRIIRVAISVNVNCLADGGNVDELSSDIFALEVGIPRLLKLFNDLKIASQTTWFVSPQSLETYPHEVQKITRAGCELGIYGSENDNRQTIRKCIKLATRLGKQKPTGYRSPTYTIKDSAIDALEELGIQYDSSLLRHDCQPSFVPKQKPIDINLNIKPSQWLQGTLPYNSSLVEIPASLAMEDRTPSFDDAWRRRFNWLYENEKGDFIFPIILHPGTSGTSHTIPLVEQLLKDLTQREGVTFTRCHDIAQSWKDKRTGILRPHT